MKKTSLGAMARFNRMLPWPWPGDPDVAAALYRRLKEAGAPADYRDWIINRLRRHSTDRSRLMQHMEEIEGPDLGGEELFIGRMAIAQKLYDDMKKRGEL